MRSIASVAIVIFFVFFNFRTALAASSPDGKGPEPAIQNGSKPPAADPSPITLEVDAREAPRKILHSRLVIPAEPGALTLFYPKWIPGEHGPTGPVTDLAGLKFTANGKPLAWQRDLLDMYAFHCSVPQGAHAVEVSLDFLLPATSQGFSSGASATPYLADLSWNQVLLYPQGMAVKDLIYAVSLQLPEGWKFATALPVAGQSNGVIEFKPVAVNTLIDSPLIAGAYFRLIPLVPVNNPPGGQSAAVEIDLAGDSEEALGMSPALVANYTSLVAEANMLFGARHYQQYHFLYTLSDSVASFGLEHHQSSDNRVGERTLIDTVLGAQRAGLLPHEFVHSWNGKYRRPADLATSDYQQPMRTDLLWVYEGLTEYLGDILTARSGLWSPEQYRGVIARNAAYLDNEAGRAWRPLKDTAIAAQLLYEAASAWEGWRRGVDFYEEGELIWLEADVIIRQLSKGARSLDDFCRRFYGAPGGPPAVKTYTFDDVIAALNDMVSYNWRAFFTTRLDSINPHAPLAGIERSGWRLVYSSEPDEMFKAMEKTRKKIDLTYSIGLIAKENGSLIDVIPGKAAYQAGLGPGMKIIAVNGRRFSPAVLHAAIRAAKNTSKPLELLVANQKLYTTCQLDYHDGEKYPRLERDPSRSDLLSQILKPLSSKAGN